MTASPEHRKRVRHFDEPGHAHELTFSCDRRLPLLTRDGWMDLLAQRIDAAIQRHDFRLIGFVFMPEHIHLVVLPGSPAATVAELLYGIKRPFSFRVKQLLQLSQDRLLEELTVRERPGKQCVRFWQEGPGYDRNLTSREAVLTALDYFHQNPVVRGLCNSAAEWRWSSWRHYHDPELPADPALPRLASLPDWF